MENIELTSLASDGSAQIEGDIENIYETMPENSQPMHAKITNETTNPLRTRILNKKLMQNVMMIIIGAAIVIIPGALCYAFLDLDKNDCAIQVNESEMERMKMENIKLKKELTEANKKTDILSKSLNNSHDHLIGCQESSSKTIQDKDFQIKTQANEITNIRKELAEHTSTLQQLNECHINITRVNRKKDEEIKQSKTENEKLKTRQNSTLFQLNECLTSKNKTILEKDMEIKNKLSEISKLQTELAAKKNLTDQRRDCLNGNQSSHRSEALYVAAEKGHTAKLLTLLEDGENPNGIWGERESALYVASLYGHIEAATALIKYGANVNYAREGDGWTPLMVAAREGHVQIVKLLLAHKATVTAKDVDGDTALSFAASSENLQNKAVIVAILKAAGAKKISH